MALATSTCADDGRCGCKGLWNDAGGVTCVLPPEIGKRLPTHSPSAYMKAPFQARLLHMPSTTFWPFNVRRLRRLAQLACQAYILELPHWRALPGLRVQNRPPVPARVCRRRPGRRVPARRRSACPFAALVVLTHALRRSPEQNHLVHTHVRDEERDLMRAGLPASYISHCLGTQHQAHHAQGFKTRGYQVHLIHSCPGL